ncbi:helix-turn-helix domain-containing protein [Candidatus Kaiserbacteria bacterium]|nr:helix-turn-helix domain-containing protein [Candidatus Kaiserbacteria bacterium]
MVRDEKKLEMATYYRKRGFSYSEIAKIVGVSKGTVSAWLSKKSFSKKIKTENIARSAKDSATRLRLINSARYKERSKLYAQTIKDAKTQFKLYKKDPLFIAGLMLYRSVGASKDERLIRVTNSELDIHRIFIKFSKTYLGVEKDQIKFWLLLYPDLVEKSCVNYWSKGLKLKSAQWYKNQVVSGRSKKQTLLYGVGNTIIGGTVLRLRLITWVELALKEL